jgi:hypothetical protein
MKQYTTGFITAVCLTASVFMFVGAQNKKLGDIIADSITLVGENGYTVITDGLLATYNADRKKTAYLGTGEGGEGFIETSNADGKKTAYLGTGEDDNGHLETYNADGKMSAYLGSAKSGNGFLETFNNHGVKTGYFGTGKDNDGIIGLCDRYGDMGWAARGKK